MIPIDIPGFGHYSVRHLVLDLNGTLTLDGTLIRGVRERLELLSENVEIHVLTADTMGRAAATCRDLPVTLSVISKRDEVEAKKEYLQGLDRDSAAAGNGRNDAGMLEAAVLGIAIVGPEGTSLETLRNADVMVSDINDGLDLLLFPHRLKATLRR